MNRTWLGAGPGAGLGTWYGDRNIKCNPEFDGNPETDSRTGDGGIEGTRSGKSEVCRDAEGMIFILRCRKRKKLNIQGC